MIIWPQNFSKRKKVVTLIVILIACLLTLHAFWMVYAHIKKGREVLPPDLQGRVSVEKVRQLEAIVGEEVVSAEDYKKKRELVYILSEVAPVLWKVRKNYYRDISQQEFEEKILSFVAQLDPHSSYESQAEMHEAFSKLLQSDGGHIPNFIDDVSVEAKIKPHILAGRYGVLRVIDFNDFGGKAFDRQLADACNVIWSGASSGKIDGIILDLRGNPGGYIKNAMIVASAFMKKPGEVVLTERSYNSIGKQQVNRRLSLPDPVGINFSRLRGLPVLVLVDASSASCSEIVAGILQYFKVGVVASKDAHTYGKGVVQSVMDFKGKKLGRLSLTTHEYFIGHDRRVHGYGIFPDIRLKGDVDDEAIFEENLRNPILPSGEAPLFIPMCVRDPLLDAQAHEMLKALNMAQL